jgi:hypothetical protein
MRNWLQKFKKFRREHLLFQYFTLVFTKWQAVLWGGSMLAVLWGIAFIVVNSLPASLTWINWVAVIIALFFAGYYIWRVDHVRLIPKLDIDDLSMKYAPMGADKKRRFVQIRVKCKTEGLIEDCRGQLLRILKWSDGKWEPTHIDEALDLWWSFVDGPTVRLEDGAPRHLNVFFVENTSRNAITWSQIQLRLPYAPLDIFKFVVRVAAKDCPAEYISLRVTFGDQWCDLVPEMIGNETI